MVRRVLIASLSSLILMVSPSVALASEASTGLISEGPATQMATVQYVFRSEKTGRDYLIKVTSPLSNPSPQGQRLPVIYALDGGYDVAGPITWLLAAAGGMRQAYVVSVGYLPRDYHWRDYDLAFRSYKDEHSARMIGSGAVAFRSFLQEELRPFITKRLPVDDRKAILFGHSEGGLFAANILADRPEEYAGYVIASPAVWSDPSIVERLRSVTPKLRSTSIYLSIGGDETPGMLADEGTLNAILSSADSSVRVKSQTFDGGTHLSYYPALVSSALPWMLGRG